jgi:predicted aspartyl protease
MVFTYEYDTKYAGPAIPVAEIHIAQADHFANPFVLRALIDSGADATFIPIRHLRRIQAKKVDERRARDASGLSYPVDIYAVSITVGPFKHPAIEVVGNRQSEDTILGRDILNHLIVTLNGLAYVVEISD